MSDEGEFDHCRDLYTTSSSRERLREFFDRAVSYGRRVLAPAGTHYDIAHSRLREALDTLRDYGYLNGYTLDTRDEPVISLTQPQRDPAVRQHDLRALTVSEAWIGGDQAVQERDRDAYVHAVDRLNNDAGVRTDNVAAFFFNRGAMHGRASNREDRRQSLHTWRPMRVAPRDGSTLLIRVPTQNGRYSFMEVSHASGTGTSLENEPALWLNQSGVVVSSDEVITMATIEFVSMPLPPSTEPAETLPVSVPAEGWSPKPAATRPNRRMRI